MTIPAAPELAVPPGPADYLTRTVMLGAGAAILAITALGAIKTLGEVPAQPGPMGLLVCWALLAWSSLRSARRGGRLVMPLMGAQTAIVCTSFALFDPVAHGAIGMFLLNTGLLALILRGPPAALTAGAQAAVCMVCLWSLQWPITLEYPAPWLLQPAIVGFGAGWALRRSFLARLETARLAAHLSQMNDVLEENLRTSQALAATRERTRIAQELHDRLGHCLTTTHVYLQVAQRGTEPDSPLGEALTNATAMTRHGLMELRSCVVLLRDPEADRPLVESIRRLVERIPPSVLDAQLVINGAIRTFGSIERFALLRTAQEGLTNVLRHAHARSVTVELSFDDDHVALTIADDGVGNDAPRLGIGLTGIRNRLRELGGRLHLETRAGLGYRLRAELATS